MIFRRREKQSDISLEYDTICDEIYAIIIGELYAGTLRLLNTIQRRSYLKYGS